MAKYDYSTINNLKSEIFSKSILDENGKISWKKHEALFDEYEKEIGKQVDRETFLAYEYSKFDVHVDVTELLCTMKRIYPETNQRWVLLKVGKFIAEDEKIGSTKSPVLNHAILAEPIREMGMTTYELLGLTFH